MGGPKQEQQPARDAVEQVAPGVLRAQLPIAMPGLGHVNCYVIPDDAGCAVVDPGMPGLDSWATFERKLKESGFDVGHVHTVVVTHTHPDHFGAVGRLASESGAKVVTHSAFRLWWAEDPNDPCEQIHDVDPADLPESNPFEGGTPWGGRNYDRPRSLQMDPGHFQPPRPTHRVKDGDRLRLGGREWWAVHTPGHTLDHLCLFDPEEGTFLSGDHVLPQITPHISGIGQGRNPLASYTASLTKVAELPGVKRVLPAHGLEFDDLPGRVESIHRHHEERLDRVKAIAEAIGEGDVEAFSHELFRQAVWGPAAESETYAHLELLRLKGEVVQRWSDGRAYYRLVP